MVAIGDVRRIEVQWTRMSQMQLPLRHRLTDAQLRILQLLNQDLSSIEISYNLFAETRAFPDTVRASFHHAKCYIGALKRFHRLMTSLGRDGWPRPVAQVIKQLVKRDESLLDAYTEARNAIEHVDNHGRSAVWWMALLGEDLEVSKEKSGNTIKVRVFGGDALLVAERFLHDFLSSLVSHFGSVAPPTSEPK